MATLRPSDLCWQRKTTPPPPRPTSTASVNPAAADSAAIPLDREDGVTSAGPSAMVSIVLVRGECDPCWCKGTEQIPAERRICRRGRVNPAVSLGWPGGQKLRHRRCGWPTRTARVRPSATPRGAHHVSGRRNTAELTGDRGRGRRRPDRHRQLPEAGQVRQHPPYAACQRDRPL